MYMNKDDVVSVKIQVDLPPAISEKLDKLVFFHKGDLVKHKRLIETSPVMLVDKVLFKTDSKGNFETDSFGKKVLAGIQCSWFNKTDDYVSHVFNSKDLVVVDAIEKGISLEEYD